MHRLSESISGLWSPSLDVAYFSFYDNDDREINGNLDELDERLLSGAEDAREPRHL